MGLGPACHSETARRERKLDWAGERNTDFLKAVVGTLSPFKCRVGGDRIRRTSFPTPSWRPGHWGLKRERGMLVGEDNHTATALHWAEDKGA